MILRAESGLHSLNRLLVASLTLSVWLSISATTIHAQGLDRHRDQLRGERPVGQLPSPQSSAGGTAQTGNDQESQSDLKWFTGSLLVIPLGTAGRSDARSGVPTRLTGCA